MKFCLLTKIPLTVLLICVLCLCSCSPNVFFNDDRSLCEYAGNEYIYCDYSMNSTTNWRVYLTKSEVNFEGIVLLGKGGIKPNTVFSTKEESPNFIIVSQSTGSDLSHHFTRLYIRYDFNILSIYETAYGRIDIEYGDSVSENEKYLDDIPEGLTFYDIVGGNVEKQNIMPPQSEYYCTLYCSYPDVSYLKCAFDIVKSGDEYYLSMITDNDDVLYYRIKT